MAEYGNKIGRVLFPLLLHTAISIAVAFLIGGIRSWWGGTGAGEAVLDGTDATLITVATAAVCIPVFWKIWKRDRARFPIQKKEKAALWLYAAALLGGILASCFFSLLMDAAGVEQYFSNQVQEELFLAGFLLQVVGLGGIVPVLEELLYRGIMYQRLREFLDVKPAVAAATLIFALAHGNMIQFLYALPMAVILHLLWEKSGSLVPPILFHMGANLISVFGNLMQ